MTYKPKSAYGRLDPQYMPPEDIQIKIRMRAIGDWNREGHLTKMTRERFVGDRELAYIADWQKENPKPQDELRFGVNI